MNYWHDLDLSDWHKYEKKGDRYVPYSQYLRKFKEAEFIYPDTHKGRGIVIAAGGDLLPGAYVTCRLLRGFGCTLPIEIWSLGAHEMTGAWEKAFTFDESLADITLYDTRKSPYIFTQIHDNNLSQKLQEPIIRIK